MVKDKFKGELNNIVDINDESDKSGMRAVITLKKDSNTEEVIALLLKHTDMQIAYNINTVAIGKEPVVRTDGNNEILCRISNRCYLQAYTLRFGKGKSSCSHC